MATRQPLPRFGHAAVGIGSKLYVWGGHIRDSTFRTSTLEIFDVPSVMWEEAQVLHGSDIPDGLYLMAVAADGETSYSLGGGTGSSHPYTYHNNLFQITPSQHLCQELQPTSLSHTTLLPDKIGGNTMVQFNDKLVVCGGINGNRPTSELYVFDLRTSECERCH